MSNLQIKDGAAATKYTKATGAGTDLDPFIFEHKETSATAIAASAASVDTKTPALGQALAAASVPVILPATTITTLTPPAAIAGFATAANQATEQSLYGALTETAPATDTASSGLNGRLQRIAQRVTSLIALIPAALTGSGNFKTAILEALVAGENLIGKVAGTALVVTPTITVDTAVYAAGDTVGGKITLPNAVRVSGGSSLLYSIHIFDRSNQKPTGNILIFNADPTAATITDNAAFVYSTDDFKQLTRVPIAASDYVTVNSKASAGLTNIGRMVKAATGTSLYAVFVTDGAPDFVAATDLQIIFNFIPVD